MAAAAVAPCHPERSEGSWLRGSRCRPGGCLTAEPPEEDRHTLDIPALIGAIEGAGLQAVHVRSTAADRESYLRRPELGGRLDRESLGRLRAQSGVGRDAVVVVADGHAPRAAEADALPLLRAAVPRLEAMGWRTGPIIVAEQATVELGDDIGAAMGARLAVVLIGERGETGETGSLAIYLTSNPAPGRTAAERSRIGGIGPTQSSYQSAAATLVRLMTEARARRRSGAFLTDDTGAAGA